MTTIVDCPGCDGRIVAEVLACGTCYRALPAGILAALKDQARPELPRGERPAADRARAWLAGRRRATLADLARARRPARRGGVPVYARVLRRLEGGS